MRNIATALAGVALAANLYAAELEHVTAVRNYIIENGRHEVAHNLRSCALTATAEGMGYSSTESAIEFFTNCGRSYDEYKFLMISIQDNGKNPKTTVIVDGFRHFADEKPALDGQVDLAIINPGNGVVYVLGRHEAANKFQKTYDGLIGKLYQSIQNVR